MLGLFIIRGQRGITNGRTIPGLDISPGAVASLFLRLHTVWGLGELWCLIVSSFCTTADIAAGCF